MNEPIAEREALWAQFLQRWPLESLASMTLQQYSQAGNTDCFVYWLEAKTESLGSIWGGSSFKFGVYSRKDQSDKVEGSSRRYSSDYAWLAKYGDAAEAAFEQVRANILQVAQAARRGDLAAVDQVDLGHAYKWKLAFLYQDRQAPCVLPIYLHKYLRVAFGAGAPQLTSALQRALVAEGGDEPILLLADRLLAEAQTRLKNSEHQEDILGRFKAVDNLSARLTAADATQAFCDLALALHEQGLDWWITDAGCVHAGRTEDPKVWQTAVTLRIEVREHEVLVALNGAQTPEAWQPLDEAIVDELLEAAALDTRVQPLSHRQPHWPEDYDKGGERLVVLLTDGAIRNGYIALPKLQALFPGECIADEDQEPGQRFKLSLPNGETLETCVLKKFGRIQARFGALFTAEKLQADDRAVLSKTGDYVYQLRFARQGETLPAPAEFERSTGQEAVMNDLPLNQILFGPPGTGKTYATIEAALEVLDSRCLQDHRQDRVALKQRFDQLADEGRIRFVTFHQSFSYEDFVEGLRAENDEATGQLRYEVVDGVFKSLCEVASAKVTQQAVAPMELGGRKVWKMSLGNTLGSDASIYEECVQGSYMLLGYGGGIDFSGCKNRSDVKQRFANAGVTLDGANDYSLTSVSAFVTKMKVGDFVVVSDGNFKFRAIGEITGDYAFKPHADYEDGYAQMRPVKWLRQYGPSLPHGELLNAQFSQMTLYELRSPTLNREKLKALLGAPEIEGGSLLHVGQRFGQGYVVRSVGHEVVEFDKPRGGVLPLPLSLLRQLLAYVRSGQIDVEDIRQGRVFEKVAEAELEKYIVNGYQSLFAAMVEQLLKTQEGTAATDARVLIIDEINRGNVSRIFGELITLIEPSKRAGAEEALSVVLPYSKQRFSVPSNVYLIGTMNTADRSLAGLDIALRRRFVFKEMLPDHQLLKGVLVEDIDIGELLEVMNQRIEVLLDRDHCLGHAYFIPLKAEPSLQGLETIFRNQILPLLQEYFFEDWQRIQWVLNDHRKPAVDRFVEQTKPDLNSLFGSSVAGVQGGIWRVMPGAFKRASAYAGIISAKSEVPVLTSNTFVAEAVD